MSIKPALEEIEKILIHCDLSEKIEIDHEFGKQIVIPFTGRALGPCFKGKVLPGGIDIQDVRKDGLKNIAARYWIETEEGEKIFIENRGIINDYGYNGKKYFRTTPRFVTGTPKYSWLNDNIFIGTGESTEEGLEIVIYRCL